MQHGWAAYKVVKARKQYGVKYPVLYLDASHKDAEAYNCVQRAHQNSLENLPAFLTLLTLSGLQVPHLASLVGVAYCAGRVRYINGYSTGDPKARLKGGFLHLATLVQLGMVAAWAVELLLPLYK